MIGGIFSGSSRGASPPWLLTMTDLILLLLTFFTMMFAVSQPDPARYPEVAQSYTQTFAADAVPVPPGSAVLSFAKVPDRAGDDIDYLAGVLRTAFDATPTLKQMEFRRANQYLIMSLPAEDVFAARGAVPKDETGALVFDLAGVLSNLRNPIAVVGSGSGWALGVTRAENLVEALLAAGLTVRPSVLARSAADETIEILIFADGSRF
jgi:chemotaxis protein MotB